MLFMFLLVLLRNLPHLLGSLLNNPISVINTLAGSSTIICYMSLIPKELPISGINLLMDPKSDLTRHNHHSWIWSEMWVELFCRREVKRSVPVSYRMGNWKWVRKTITNKLKSTNECCGSSIYHFVAISVNVLWKSLKRIESSIMELDEHHRWKVITWFFGSSPCFSSNFDTSKGNLTKIVGKKGSCWMGSLINLDNFVRSKVAKNRICGLGCG